MKSLKSLFSLVSTLPDFYWSFLLALVPKEYCKTVYPSHISKLTPVLFHLKIKYLQRIKSPNVHVWALNIFLSKRCCCRLILKKKKIYVFILVALGLCCCIHAFSSYSEWELLSSSGMWASHCSGFSCCGAWALGMWASVVGMSLFRVEAGHTQQS